jgi:type IV fimbrial biogenesis protein FimT
MNSCWLLFPHERRRPFFKERGVTLIELLVVLSVLSVLLSLTWPAGVSLYRSILANRYANAFQAHLTFARSEAIKRGGRVVICKSADGIGCTHAGGWEQGYIVFADNNNDAGLSDGEQLILVQGPLPNGATLRGNSHVENYVSYSPMGATRLTSGGFQAGTLTLCFSGNVQRDAVLLVISSTGRVRSQKAVTGVDCNPASVGD